MGRKGSEDFSSGCWSSLSKGPTKGPIASPRSWGAAEWTAVVMIKLPFGKCCLGGEKRMNKNTNYRQGGISDKFRHLNG